MTKIKLLAVIFEVTEAIQTMQMGQKIENLGLKKLIHKYPFLPVFIFAFMSDQVKIFKIFV